MTSKLTSFGHKRSSSAEHQDCPKDSCIPVDEYEATFVSMQFSHTHSRYMHVEKYPEPLAM